MIGADDERARGGAHGDRRGPRPGGPGRDGETTHAPACGSPRRVRVPLVQLLVPRTL